MRGTTARHLRQIAREVSAEPKTSYFYAVLRGWREKARAGKRDHSMTRVLGYCFRRAYKEAKRIYLNKPPTALQPHADVAGAWR